jgi:hypothetical protein
MWIRNLGPGSLYWAGSLVTVSKELSEYKLELVGVKELRGHAVA